MGTPLRTQALRLVLALLLGLGEGLLYDLLRPPRRRLGRCAALPDLLFSLCAGLLAFLFAMGAGSGRLGLWELTSILLGFLLYLYAFSPLLLPLLERGTETWLNIIASCKKGMEKGPSP